MKKNLKQPWYDKASVQSSIVNAIPNLLVALIAIVSIIISVYTFEKQVTQSQHNFDLQMKRDSIFNAGQDEVTKKNIMLAQLQTELSRRQFLNDSINKSKELVIADKEYSLFQKQNFESDIITTDNLYIETISFRSYETKYQQENLDSTFGFSPDISYPEQGDSMSNNFRILFSLTLMDLVTLKEIPYLPILQTKDEIENYISRKNIFGPVQVLKKYTIVIEVKNATKFPIKMLQDSNTFAKFEMMEDTSFKLPIFMANNRLVYPNMKARLGISIYAPIELKLDKQFILNFSIDYKTLYGVKTKKIKAQFIPEEKFFEILD